MSYDPYAPCPCGSGKKLKFCCMPVAEEMDKAIRLYQGNQLEASLRTLDALVEKHPENPWVVCTRAMTLFNEGRGTNAIPSLERLLQARPDHPGGLAMLALGVMARSGFESNKPLMHRALQRSAAAEPELLAQLIRGAAIEFSGKRKIMAARQHLALALRLAPYEMVGDLFQELVAFDEDRQSPFPFRSIHTLAEIAADGDAAADIKKAAQVADRGCYGPAGVLFQRLAEQQPDNAALWYNVGLCRAWDGDEPGAAEAFHRAARLETDFERAVEIEALAQLLEQNTDPDPILRECVAYNLAVPVPQLLARLDESDRLHCERRPEGAETVVYMVLDFAPEIERSADAVDLDRLPRILGLLHVVQDEPGESHRAPVVLFALTPLMDEARRVVEEVAGGVLTPADSPVPPVRAFPREYWPLSWATQYHPETPQAVCSAIGARRWRKLEQEIWPNMPLAALSGRTPLAAAGDPELKVPLAAALLVFDSYCDSRGHELDVAAMRERLGLPPQAPLEIDEQTLIVRLSVVEMERLPLSRLTDTQFRAVVQRALLIRHGRFLRAALLELLERPELLTSFDVESVYDELFNLDRHCEDRSRALRWIRLGKEKAAETGKIERSAQWEFKEFAFRAETPDDPELGPIADHLWNHYGRKVPSVRSFVRDLAQHFMLDLNLPDDEVAGAAVGSLWTPEKDAAETAGGRKLWLPGQE